MISYGLVHSSDLSSVIKKIKGFSGGHLLLPKGRIDYMSRVLGSCLSNLFSKISSYGDFITSLGNLCQGITILIIRKFFFSVCRNIYWKIYHSCWEMLWDNAVLSSKSTRCLLTLNIWSGIHHSWKIQKCFWATPKAATDSNWFRFSQPLAP